MPNIRSMSVDNTGVKIVASDGSSITLTTAQVLAEAKLLPNVQSLINWIALQIQNGLGPGMVDASLVQNVTVSLITGVVSHLEVTS